MSKSNHELPLDLHGIDERLRAQRGEWTAIELDRIKRRAMVSRTKGVQMRPKRIARRVVALAVAASVSVGGMAIAGDHFAPGNSGSTKPGKGCGDKNHYHEKEDQCKKGPK